jgi:hypothetical protein
MGVSPASNSAADYFLHVLTATDTSVNTAPRAGVVTSSGQVAVGVGADTVVFTLAQAGGSVYINGVRETLADTIVDNTARETGPALAGHGVGLTVYPNPFTGKTVILLNGVVAGGVETLHPGINNPGRSGCNVSTTRPRIAIYNINGKLIEYFQSAIIHPSRHEGTIEWDASGLPSGVYIVRAETGGRVFRKRICLVR